jgi:hypothetical protein
VDGDFGAGSEAEMMRVLATRGETLTAATPVERLTGLAAVYWRQGVFRVDLY